MRSSSSTKWFFGLLISAAVVGCGSNVKIPTDATLLWLGDKSGAGDIKPPPKKGQLYLVDDFSNQVISVSPVDTGTPKGFVDSMKDGRKYRVYFEADLPGMIHTNTGY